MARLSVVIPAYNNGEYIAATMRSILEQDFTDFELIVADHSSTDNTLEVVGEFSGDPRVTVLSTPAGGGARANWQRVTDAAGGELLKLVCGDDVLYQGALRVQVAAFDSNPTAVLVANSRDILDASGVPFVANRGLAGLEGLVDGREAIRRSVRAGTNLLGEPMCVMVRREVLQDAGGWDGLHPYVIDQASYARVLLVGPMVGIREAKAGFRVNAGQWSVALAAKQSRQVSAFHDHLHATIPGLLSRSDVLLGNTRARIAALSRRAVYVVYRKRLSSALATGPG